jgi:proteasome alpha subunit
VAEVGEGPDDDQMYRISYDGTIVDEPDFLVMGGQADAVTTQIRRTFKERQPLAEALAVAVRGLGSVGGNSAPRALPANQLEVAVLDRRRPTRKFKRFTGAALTALLPREGSATPAESAPPDSPRSEPDGT